ncbi:LOW QUALITY PROTEIN: hypothetical protein U9M48_010333 [Paspalum notatum var. saurae]|uniref:CCHC-type domain-containing protein n=1 Tax=Paspalum notatum var. saurae TaxID=547442 RepID=A0AAQ3SUK4_PASNO
MSESPESSGAAGRTAVTSGVVELPMLTRTNYHEWSLAMKLGGARAVESEKVERQDDRIALAAVLRGVPSELKATLAVKNTTKEAWEAVKKMRVGEDRVKNANRQHLLKEFENLKWKDGESTDDFAVHVNTIVCGLRELGEDVKDGRVVPTKWKQVAVSIEMLLDLDTMSMEELVERLHVAEDADAEDAKAKDVVSEGVGRLYLTEEQWEARHRQRIREQKRAGDAQRGSGGDGRRVGGKNRGNGGRGDDDDGSDGDDEVSSMCSGRSRRGGRPRCFECGKRGHFARECRDRKEKKESALLASAEEEPTLL